MQTKTEVDIQQQLQQLMLQQKHLQIQLTENNQRMQLILRRVWQLNDTTQKRIANDLHDGVGQVLTALVNELAGMKQSGEQQRRALALAEIALKDTRQISRLLRPPVLDDLGLQPALKWLIRQISESYSQLKISLVMPSDLTLNEELQIMVFRVCQEALTNVVKYAAATRACVEISQDRDGLKLSISDNGVGFELSEQTEKGVGLSSIQDRAASFGGLALVETAPTQGCKISIIIPIQAISKESK
jgi:two-component system, NarL family, sensor kinase